MTPPLDEPRLHSRVHVLSVEPNTVVTDHQACAAFGQRLQRHGYFPCLGMWRRRLEAVCDDFVGEESQGRGRVGRDIDVLKGAFDLD